MWHNHHTITILNFLVAQIVVMDLKFNSILINQEIAMIYCYEKGTSTLVAPFLKGQA